MDCHGHLYNAGVVTVLLAILSFAGYSTGAVVARRLVKLRAGASVPAAEVLVVAAGLYAVFFRSQRSRHGALGSCRHQRLLAYELSLQRGHPGIRRGAPFPGTLFRMEALAGVLEFDRRIRNQNRPGGFLSFTYRSDCHRFAAVSAKPCSRQFYNQLGAPGRLSRSRRCPETLLNEHPRDLLLLPRFRRGAPPGRPAHRGGSGRTFQPHQERPFLSRSGHTLLSFSGRHPATRSRFRGPT
jgi:hypothetical protein